MERYNRRSFFVGETPEGRIMETYDYREAVKNDVVDYIKNEINFANYADIDELSEHLNDTLWDVDGVTGNASGSYTFSTWQAEENLCHNLDLLEEACDEFGCDMDESVKKGAEYCDVTIRCYLLGEAISEALEELEDEFYKVHG